MLIAVFAVCIYKDYAERSRKKHKMQQAQPNKSQKSTEALKSIRKKAFIKTLPVMCSYLFIGMAYGMLMENAGFAWYYALLTSAVVYTGAFQFVLVTFLSGGASLLTVALTALLMNSRHAFYSISFIDDFRSMGKRKNYMIRTMTDETYALNCSIGKDDPDRKEMMFWMAVFSRTYWLAASAAGGILGQLIPYDLTGIDFCMTALFVILFIDQWEQAEDHKPAIVGLGIASACLVVFGTTSFMLPSLILVSAILMVTIQYEQTSRTLLTNDEKGEVQE